MRLYGMVRAKPRSAKGMYDCEPSAWVQVVIKRIA